MSDKGEPVSSELGKRSRRSGWDVDEEPAKLTRSSSDLNISGTAVASIVPVASIASVPPLMVSSASSAPLQQANTNFAAMTAQMLAQQVLAKSGLPTGVSAQQQAPKMENRIYVGSLPYSLKEPDVVALFSAFGPIVRCDMSYDLQLGRSKGFCFVEFHDPVTAQAAMAMDGFELAGRRIKVGRPSQMPNGGGGGNAKGMGSFLPANPLLAAAALSSSARLAQQAVAPAAAWSGSLPVPTAPSVPPAAPTVATATPFVLVRNIRSSLALSEIQDLFGLHGAIKSSKQLQSTSLDPSLYYDVLLEYSDGSAAATKAATTMNGYMLSRTQLAVEAIPLTRAVELMVQKVESASTLQAKTVVLEDMVTVEDTREPELKDEIEEEAKKHGAIEHIDISVSPDGQKAVVKVTYSGPADAARACKALNGRGFAGRKIRASVQ